MLYNVWNCPSEVAILKPKSCDNLVLLFRSEQQRFGLIWSGFPGHRWGRECSEGEPTGGSTDIPEPISRKFIRENFIEFDDIDNILFNLDSSCSAWAEACKKIMDGEVSVVKMNDILKGRSR